MSGAVVSDKVWKVLVEASTRFGVFEHGYTNSGHPVAAAAALASLDIIEPENLVENAARVGAYLQQSCARPSRPVARFGNQRHRPHGRASR